jgi:hypothetical protein
MSKAAGQNGGGTQAEDAHTSEGGNTAADELDRLAEEQAGEGDGTGADGTDTTGAGGEGDGAGTGEGETGGEGENNGEGEDTRVEFTPEQQEVFNKRLGKEIEKRRTVETQLEDLKKGTTSNDAEIARSIKLHPAYVSKDDFALIQTVNVLESEQEALAEAQADDEVTLESLPASTQKWIKETYPKTETVDKKMLAKRIMLIQRELQSKSAKADAAYEAGKTLQLSDLAWGRKRRLDQEAARNKATRKPGDKNQPAKASLKTGTRPVATGTETRKGGVDQNKLKAGGNTVEALMDAM